MTKEERANQIAFAERQFEIFKMYAMRAFASATTGTCKLNNVSQGREPTVEERDAGMTVGWNPLTDEEKVQRELETMQRHIQLMSETNDAIDSLRRGEG